MKTQLLHLVGLISLLSVALVRERTIPTERPPQSYSGSKCKMVAIRNSKILISITRTK